MPSSEIVCQVTNQDSQVEFTWSMGGGFYRPYVVAGAQLAELRKATRLVRIYLEFGFLIVDLVGNSQIIMKKDLK